MGILDRLKRWLGAPDDRLPPEQGRGIEELARRLGLPADELRHIEPSYHQYTIAKRGGGKRTITAPSDPFKSFQRRLLRRVIGRLPVHPAALVHAMKPVVVKMDIRDFFPATRTARIHAYLRTVGWNEEATRWLVRWCTHDGGLPQGAPPSGHLSNAVNQRLDARLSALAAGAGPRHLDPQSAPGAFYSRYADDLTFSFGRDDHTVIQGMIHGTKRIVEDEQYRLHTRKKLRIMRHHDRQLVTGLVVNGKVNLPRETRRWLRAVEHHLATGRPATLTAQQLAGWRALQQMVAEQTGRG